MASICRPICRSIVEPVARADGGVRVMGGSGPTPNPALAALKAAAVSLWTLDDPFFQYLDLIGSNDLTPTGTVINFNQVTGKLGNAANTLTNVHLSGTSIGIYPENQSRFFSFWVKVGLVDAQGLAGNSQAWSLRIYGGQYQFLVNNPVNSLAAVSFGSPVANVYDLVIVCFNQTTNKLGWSLNGSAMAWADGTVEGGIKGGSYPFTLNGNTGWNSSNDTTTDEPGVYYGIPTQEMIDALWNGGDGVSNADIAAAANIPVSPYHSYWRVNVSAFYNYCAISEIEMAASISGSDQCNGGTASASSYHASGLLPAYAFDNVLDDANCWATAGSAIGWIQYAFPSPVAVAEVRIAPRYSVPQYPTAFTLEFSDDGLNWRIATAYSGLTVGWAINTLRSFPV